MVTQMWAAPAGILPSTRSVSLGLVPFLHGAEDVSQLWSQPPQSLGKYLTNWLIWAAFSVKFSVPVDSLQVCFSLNCLISFRLQPFPAGMSRCCYLNQGFLLSSYSMQ